MDTEYVAPLADPGTVEPAAPSTATDSPAPVSPEAYYRRRFAHATHDELVAEIIRLHRGYGTELADTERELCQALGMVEDPEYGYPTGDMTTPVLATVLRDRVAVLHAALASHIAVCVDATDIPAITPDDPADDIKLAEAHSAAVIAELLVALNPAEAKQS